MKHSAALLFLLAGGRFPGDRPTELLVIQADRPLLQGGLDAITFAVVVVVALTGPQPENGEGGTQSADAVMPQPSPLAADQALARREAGLEREWTRIRADFRRVANLVDSR